MANSVFIGVVVARFLLPLFIPKFPLPAVLACLVVDAVDQTIFQALTDGPLAGYQSYDKALDVHYLSIAYFSTMRNWRDPIAFQVARFLFLYRLVGTALFELVDQRWILLVFPNTFEYFFIAYEALRTRWNPARLTAASLVAMAAVIWVVIKLPQEWWIHIAGLDFTDVMADRPYLWLVLLGAAVALGIGVWARRRRIPPADWRFTMAVDTNLPTLEEDLTGREPFFTAILAEKVVVLALVAVIFAQVLPVRSTNLGLAAGVSTLVVLNGAISQWLRRSGIRWDTTGVTFAAMLAINVGIVTVDSVFGSNRDANTPSPSTVFFTVLLSLLIALFDRYRSPRNPTADQRSVWAAVRADRLAVS